MTKRSVTPHTMVLERTLKYAPSIVFKAWADPASKASWFTGPPDWHVEPHSLDFRVGGIETSAGGPKGGDMHIMQALYHEIIPDQRLIYSFTMHVGEVLLTVSLATLEFVASGSGTHLKLIEQLVFLDGCDHLKEREEGTNAMIDMLEAYLNRQ